MDKDTTKEAEKDVIDKMISITDFSLKYGYVRKKYKMCSKLDMEDVLLELILFNCCC